MLRNGQKSGPITGIAATTAKAHFIGAGSDDRDISRQMKAVATSDSDRTTIVAVSIDVCLGAES